MKKYFVYNNDKWHLIKTSQTPKYERVIRAPEDADLADDYEFELFMEDNQDVAAEKWIATFNQTKFDKRKNRIKESKLTKESKQQKVNEAKARLKALNLNTVGEVNDLKTIISDLLISLNLKE